MHSILALVFPFFTALFQPSAGGELSWRRLTPTTPIVLKLDNDPGCVVHLSPQESLDAAEVLGTIIDGDSYGKPILPANGGELRLVYVKEGTISLVVQASATCTVSLVGIEEHEKVMDIFIDAGS